MENRTSDKNETNSTPKPEDVGYRKDAPSDLENAVRLVVKEHLAAALKEALKNRSETDLRALGDLFERTAPAMGNLVRPSVEYIAGLAKVAREHNVDLTVANIEVTLQGPMRSRTNKAE